MIDQNPTNLTAERKKMLRKDLNEGLEGLKDIFISTVRIIIKLVDYLPSLERISSLTNYSKKYESNQEESHNSLSLVKKSIREEGPDSVDVAVDIKESGNELYSKVIKNIIYPILATLSTTALLTGVAKIDPIVKWANLQNQCIEETKSTDDKELTDLSTRVMNCNGGHAN